MEYDTGGGLGARHVQELITYTYSDTSSLHSHLLLTPLTYVGEQARELVYYHTYH